MRNEIVCFDILFVNFHRFRKKIQKYQTFDSRCSMKLFMLQFRTWQRPWLIYHWSFIILPYSSVTNYFRVVKNGKTACSNEPSIMAMQYIDLATPHQLREKLDTVFSFLFLMLLDADILVSMLDLCQFWPDHGHGSATWDIRDQKIGFGVIECFLMWFFIRIF